ncbi:MAG: hypothetical protein NTY77_15640 [Elusimicrobia bacterium]|nr:hypothetical protein [Elusimicrobiota bacterium]
MPLWPAALLLLSATAFADQAQDALCRLAGGSCDKVRAKVAAVPGALVATAKLPISPECPQAAAQQLAQASERAADAASSCLNRLNPAMSGKIQKALARNKLRLLCGDETGTEGGRIERYQDGSVDLVLPLKTHAIQYPLDARIFHELIHAVDPGAQYIVSAQVHARPGSPDAVYGCQFACFGGVGTDEVDRLRNYQSQGSVSIPELEDYSCAGKADQRECPTLRRYAYLCKLGKPMIDEEALRKVRAKDLPACLVEKLMNDCPDKACVTLRGRFEASSSESGGKPPPEMLKYMLDVGGALGAALGPDQDESGLATPDAKALFKSAKARGYHKACMR